MPAVSQNNFSVRRNTTQMNNVKWKSTWPLTQPVTVMNGIYQSVPDLRNSPLPLCTVHTRQYLTSDPSPLPLFTLHTRQYLTSDPAHYRYARYIPDSTWPLTKSITVMHGTYQTVPDLWPQPVTVIHGTYQTVPELWPSPLPLCTVHTRQYMTSDPNPLPLCTVRTRQYLTSDPVHYRYARYITDTTWPLTQSITVMQGTYQTVPDLWPSPLPLFTVHTRQYLTSDPARYRYSRYIPDSTWPLTQPVTLIPPFNCKCLPKAVGPSH